MNNIIKKYDNWMKCILLVVILLVNCLFNGCKDKKENSPEPDLEKVIFCDVAGIANNENLSSDIKDYKITDKLKPLKVTQLTAEQIDLFINNIHGYARISSKQFMISYVQYLFSISELRKVENSDVDEYYCVYSNKTDNNLHLYAFFDELYDNEWRCIDYLYIKTDSSRYEIIDGEGVVDYINPIDMFL